ncbi:hypothetical protein GIS00_17165 [Nakamurella sp. YIM 132087]|uniref:Uncharacterized protein n=1 Tax=Nakamurella alba TaxID=2665158 RepID=A0A7K1FNE7_9ACTN|nr:hypothetical protein [Nakamurella alba]MTD15666.1 hypothetical protein [Nakamurella alba]
MAGSDRRSAGGEKVDTEQLHELRLQRWWLDREPLRTQPQAVAFLADVHFAQLFGTDATFPCLREVSRDDEVERGKSGWGEDLDRMWGWKDDLPLTGDGWYGHLVGGRLSLVSPHLLGLLYDHAGDEDDADSAVGLSETSRRLADFLRRNGPTSTPVLREQVCHSAADLAKARKELGRALLITHYGVDDSRAGWPSSVLELTARAFPGLGGRPRPERDRAAAAIFLDTMVDCRPRELASGFSWPIDRARAALDALRVSPAPARPRAARTARRR